MLEKSGRDEDPTGRGLDEPQTGPAGPAACPPPTDGAPQACEREERRGGARRGLSCLQEPRRRFGGPARPGQPPAWAAPLAGGCKASPAQATDAELGRLQLAGFRKSFRGCVWVADPRRTVDDGKS